MKDTLLGYLIQDDKADGPNSIRIDGKMYRPTRGRGLAGVVELCLEDTKGQATHELLHDIETLEKNVDSLECDLDESHDEISGLETKVEELEGQVEDLEKQVADLESKLEELSNP